MDLSAAVPHPGVTQHAATAAAIIQDGKNLGSGA
jgi:hypothetical protein